MRDGNNGERQQKFIERTRKTDQLITYKKNRKNRRKVKKVEEDKS